jgi:hypothetical protein
MILIVHITYYLFEDHYILLFIWSHYLPVCCSGKGNINAIFCQFWFKIPATPTLHLLGVLQSLVCLEDSKPVKAPATPKRHELLAYYGSIPYWVKGDATKFPKEEFYYYWYSRFIIFGKCTNLNPISLQLVIGSWVSDRFVPGRCIIFYTGVWLLLGNNQLNYSQCSSGSSIFMQTFT